MNRSGLSEPPDHEGAAYHDLQIVQEVLQGTLGTEAQRNAIWRIICQLRKEKKDNMATKLFKTLHREFGGHTAKTAALLNGSGDATALPNAQYNRELLEGRVNKPSAFPTPAQDIPNL